MQLIIGSQFGKYLTFEEQFKFNGSSYEFYIFYFRTKQEEMRVYHRNHPLQIDDMTNTTVDPHSTISNDTANTSSTDTGSFELTTEICMYIHGGLMAALFLFALTRSIGFYSVCVRASQTLHDSMFKGLISTTMRFFGTNPSGRILNRFSKDTGTTDELLPKAILDSTQVILSMVGAIVVTATVNPIFLVPVVVMGIAFIFIRRIYLKTSKNIKRLEGVGK